MNTIEKYRHEVSVLSKDIVRLKKICTTLGASNTRRKYQITQFHTLIRKLLSEGRLTIDEVAVFITKKKPTI